MRIEIAKKYNFLPKKHSRSYGDEVKSSEALDFEDISNRNRIYNA